MLPFAILHYIIKKIKNILFKPKLYLLKILKRYFLLLIRSRKQKVMLILRRMCW